MAAFIAGQRSLEQRLYLPRVAEFSQSLIGRCQGLPYAVTDSAWHVCQQHTVAELLAADFFFKQQWQVWW